ncbi:MAG: methyltransferase domain-containing protein [Proteobacteria bacterium]|nr:methyltransferase domain-containing protein [Pseudomonadota bacterium]
MGHPFPTGPPVSHRRMVQKYNLISPIYDIFGIIIESKARARSLEVSEITNGERILEVAVGTGLNFQEILRRNPDGWNDGIDISDRMIKRAKRRALKTGIRNYSLQLGDCRCLPFADRTFDLLINQYMFDILPVTDYGSIMKEFRRVLKPDGRLVLVNTTPPEKTRDRMLEWILRVYPQAFSKCRGVLAEPFLEEFNFRDIQREYVVNLSFPSEVVVSYK